MTTTETGITRQRLPGVLSSRIMTALFSGGSATLLATGTLFASPETAIPAIIVAVGGTAGSFLYGISQTKKNTARYAKSIYGTDNPPVPENKDIARAILGIPFEPQRVLVNSAPYVDPKRVKFLGALDPLSLKRVNRKTMLHQANIETDNYILYTNQGVYLEQVTRPSALATWDAAYNSLIDQYRIPVEKIAPRNNPAPLQSSGTVEGIMNGINREIKSIKDFMNSL
jgi:hypothetical protein